MYLAQASPYSHIYLIMILKTIIELIKGELRRVQYVQYSNGKMIKRVLDDTGIPQTIEHIEN